MKPTVSEKRILKPSKLRDRVEVVKVVKRLELISFDSPVSLLKRVVLPTPV